MMTGKAIRRMRDTVGMKQIELAKKSRVDRSRLSTAENGHVQLNDQEQAAIQKAINAAALSRAREIGKLAEIADR
jgi:transcriptional regulator with XRE-family HTH domain